MLNVLVTGSDGQLGSEIRELSPHYPCKFFFTDRGRLDIADKQSLENFVQQNAIDTIINCAAYTAVDKAEEDEKNADNINHLAVGYLAEIAKERLIRLVHLSTDYVFDGQACKPYTETDAVAPSSVYGKTKLDGELLMQRISPLNSIIVRTSWVYSSYGNNFVKTMLRLGREKNELRVIFDQVGTPTYASDLAKTILDILPKIRAEKVEIYHYTNEGVLSWYDFAKAIMDISELKCRVNPIETKDYPTPAKRPAYSLLNKAKIKNEFNIQIPYWRGSLKDCLEKMGETNQ